MDCIQFYPATSSHRVLSLTVSLTSLMFSVYTHGILPSVHTVLAVRGVYDSRESREERERSESGRGGGGGSNLSHQRFDFAAGLRTIKRRRLRQAAWKYILLLKNECGTILSGNRI